MELLQTIAEVLEVRAIFLRVSMIAREVLPHDLGVCWRPGNVRELRNVLGRALILSAGGLLTREHIALGNNRLRGCVRSRSI